MRTALFAVFCVATVAAAADSPYVSLAKRTNRAASKTVVITNETLATKQGSISRGGGETSSNAGPALLPQTAPAAAPASQQVATPARPAAPGYVRPNSSMPSTTARFVPVESSARVVTPQSSVRSSEPPTSAKFVQPPTTARSYEPASTARNVPIPGNQ